MRHTSVRGGRDREPPALHDSYRDERALTPCIFGANTTLGTQHCGTLSTDDNDRMHAMLVWVDGGYGFRKHESLLN